MRQAVTYTLHRIFRPWAGHICICLTLWFALKPLTDARMQPYRSGDWLSVIWSDKAGYYVYEPATFIYGWNGHKLPKGFPEEQAGYGFSVDTAGKIITKYPVGTAYFQTPFFLWTHYVENDHPAAATGFESPYQRSMARASLFWAILGLLLLVSALSRFVNFWTAWFSALAVLFATNLFYYAVQHPGFSHSYSFFLFSALMAAIPWDLRQLRMRHWAMAGLLTGLIFVTRSVNVLFAGLYLGFVGYRHRAMFSHYAFWIKGAILAGLAGLLPVLPQLFYWKYAYGRWLADSYRNEGFTNLFHPQWAITFWSVNNGLFLYTPLWFVFMSAPLVFVRRHTGAAVLLWVVFGLQAYLCASWWAPGFGCSFGHRAFVDVLPFAAVSLALLFQTLQLYAPRRIGVSGVIFLFLFTGACVYYLQHISLSFVGCWAFESFDHYDYEAFRRAFRF